MARTPKLSDLQLILLSTACQRTDGSLLPPPDSAGDRVPRIDKAVAALITRGLAEKVAASERSRCWREDGDRWIGVIVTDAGRAAIGAEVPEHDPAPEATLGENAQALHTEHPSVTEASLRPAPRAGSKQALLIGMLRREGGASLDELVAATGWLSHTTRAALTGLRKKGHAIVTERSNGLTRYRLASAC